MGRLAYRDVQSKVTKTAALDDGIETIDLEGLDYLSQLNLNCAVISTDNDAIGTPVYLVVTKLEILGNGSTVIKSYTPQQCRAIAQITDTDLMSLGYYARHGTDDKSFWSFPIKFGRYPGDPKYMLNTDAWETLQARITWNAATLVFDGTNLDATASPEFRYAADALVYEGGSPPGNEGYIRSMEINRYTMAASTRYTTEVPRGYPLKGIMSRACYTDKQWWYFYENMKLDFDNGKWVPLDIEDRQIPSLLAHWGQKAGRSMVYMDCAGSYDFDTQFGLCTGWAHSTTSDEPMATGLNHAPPFGMQDLCAFDATTSASTDKVAAQISTWGMMPHQCIYVPMKYFAEIGEDAVPTAEYKRIDFEHTTDSSAGAGIGTVCAEYICPQGQA